MTLGKRGPDRIKTAIYVFMGPGYGAGEVAQRPYSDTSWKNVDTGTYNGSPGNPTKGLSCGAVGSPGSGGFILGRDAAVYQQALRARGHNVDPASPDGLWRTGGTKKTLAGGGSVMSAVWVFGEALVDLCAMHDLVFLGDFPPEELVLDIKRRSRRPGGTKVIIGFFNFESIQQYEDNNSLLDPIRNRLKTRLLRSNVAGTHSTPSKFLDIFETADAPPPPPGANYKGSTSDANPPDDQPALPNGAIASHIWAANPLREPVTQDSCGASDLGFMSALIGDYKTVLESRYTSGTIDGIVFDNVNQQANLGAATNRPATIGSPAGGAGSDLHADFIHWCNPTTFQNAWRFWFRLLQGKVTGLQSVGFSRKFGKVWGNTGGSELDFTLYTADQIEARMVEFFFHASAGSVSSATLAQMKRSLSIARSKRVPILAGILLPSASFTTQVGAWLNTDGPRKAIAGAGATPDWSTLLGLLQSTGMLEDFYMLSARTSSGGTLFYHKTFGAVR